MKDVRDILALELKRRGFSQSAIATMAGLTKQQLSDIVNKRRKLDANEMFNLCLAMNIEPNILFAAAQDSA